MRICPETHEPVLYTSCMDCESRRECKAGEIPTERVYEYKKKKTVRLRRSTYADNNSLAVIMYELTDPEHNVWYEYGEVITTNLHVSYGGNYAFVDENNCRGIGKWLEQNGIAKATGILCASDFVNYPLYEFNAELIPELED